MECRLCVGCWFDANDHPLELPLSENGGESFLSLKLLRENKTSARRGACAKSFLSLKLLSENKTGACRGGHAKFLARISSSHWRASFLAQFAKCASLGTGQFRRESGRGRLEIQKSLSIH